MRSPRKQAGDRSARPGYPSHPRRASDFLHRKRGDGVLSSRRSGDPVDTFSRLQLASPPSNDSASTISTCSDSDTWPLGIDSGGSRSRFWNICARRCSAENSWYPRSRSPHSGWRSCVLPSKAARDAVAAMVRIEYRHEPQCSEPILRCRLICAWLMLSKPADGCPRDGSHSDRVTR